MEVTKKPAGSASLDAATVLSAFSKSAAAGSRPPNIQLHAARFKQLRQTDPLSAAAAEAVEDAAAGSEKAGAAAKVEWFPPFVASESLDVASFEQVKQTDPDS